LSKGKERGEEKRRIREKGHKNGVAGREKKKIEKGSMLRISPHPDLFFISPSLHIHIIPASGSEIGESGTITTNTKTLQTTTRANILVHPTTVD